MHVPHLSSQFWSIVTGVAAFAIFIASVFLFFFLQKVGTSSPSQAYIERKLVREEETYKRLNFNLVDTGEAPRSIRNLARFGYQIIINTQKNAPQYVGDRLSCTNCHFAGGNTTGGSQGGISLVGVAAQYPSYDNRSGKVIDLPTRINNCFSRSMNGKPLPLDSREMLALITYLQWISKGLPIYKPIPWRGLKFLESTHQPDSARGKRLYSVYCALCHRDNGQGGDNTPPLWGEGSFNKGAGLNNRTKLSAFIYWNMPYYEQTPTLTEEEAIDIAAYIISQPRPEFVENSTSDKSH